MRSIKLQFLLGFGVMGAVLPFMPIYLDAQGLSLPQIGYVMSTFGVAFFLSPVLMTFLADAHFQGKTLLAIAFIAAAMSMLGLLLVDGFWPILLTHFAFALSYAPQMSLQDGLNFREQRDRADRGQSPVPYHFIRGWGTMGFIIPSIILYGALAAGAPIGMILVMGIAVALAGAANTIFLPRHTYASARHAGGPDVEQPDDAQLPAETPTFRRGNIPTLEAARAMVQPTVLVFCVAIWLAHMANGAYYTFYPLYLTQTLGVADEWVGLITNLGVVIEVVFMLGFGLLLHKLGLRWLMTLGTAAIALRLGLLYAFPNVGVAVGTQLLHGITVLVIHVAPPIYLNYRAKEHFRSSMQGLFAMVIFSTGRIGGTIGGGWIAEVSLLDVFLYGAIISLVSAGLFAVLFRERPTNRLLSG